jgi:hypothetical protein
MSTNTNHRFPVFQDVFSNSLIINKYKTKKSLPWRFGYVILISIKYGQLLLLIFSKNYYYRLRLVFSTRFSVFGYRIKQSFSCSIYYCRTCVFRFMITGFRFFKIFGCFPEPSTCVGVYLV